LLGNSRCGEVDLGVSITINLELKEIYRLLCDRCKKRVKELVQKKISEKLADQVIGLEEGGEG
jgi:hypothetical protein